jgi:DNA helicase II / ATP-dependent DNA helicase PcrA
MSSKGLHHLNEYQEKAVKYDKGPLLVLAGPGAGKTTVLVQRIANILQNSKGEYFKILALTFTNKAAKEMKERVEAIVGDEVNRVFVGTFHSFAHDLIRDYGSYIGISPEFIIYEQQESIRLLIDGVRKRVDEEITGKAKRTVLSEKYLDVTLIEETMPDFYNKIARQKNALITVDNVKKSNQYSEEFRLIYEIYNTELEIASALDFQDLILYANQLLNEKPFILKKIQKINQHILIDEGQDTNRAQFELVKTLCGDYFHNLFIVADEDQLIFEWNDARFEYLFSLVKQYQAETIQFFESFRCPNPILEIANNLIKHNKNRIGTKEKLLSKKADKMSEIIEIHDFETQNDEATFVSNKIKELKNYTNTCIISRNRYMLKYVENKLKDLNIPYYIPMGQKMFTTREMNLIINFMKLIFNENDKVHLYYICEQLGINYEIIEVELNKTLLQNLLENDNPELTNINKILNDFRNNKNNFKEYFDKLKDVIIGSCNKEENHEDLFEDVELFERIYKEYKYETPSEERELGDFLSHISLAPRKDLSNKGVALLTGHAVKGLEFDFVFLISMNQGIFPDYRAKRKIRSLEEERRNCFVAITRTKKRLFLSYTHMKETRYGSRKHAPSQFLKEMGFNI